MLRKISLALALIVTPFALVGCADSTPRVEIIKIESVESEGTVLKIGRKVTDTKITVFYNCDTVKNKACRKKLKKGDTITAIVTNGELSGVKKS